MATGTAIQKPGAKYSRYLAIGQYLDAFWGGRAAEKLGIAGTLSDESSFQALTDLKDPVTGEQLKPRHKQKITMWDLTVAAPKSVSLVALYDPEVYRMHQSAAALIPSTEESYVPSKNMVYTQVHHLDSRAGDPHIHTHTPIINLTYNEGAGKWECLRPNFMNYWAQLQLQESYNLHLGHSLSLAGYTLTDREKFGFNIAGVSQELTHRFSTRAQELEEFSRKRIEEGKRDYSYYYRGAFVRPTKQVYAESYDIRIEQQKERLTQAERISLKETVEIAQEKAYRLNLRHGLRWDVGDAEDSGPELKIHSYGHRISI